MARPSILLKLLEEATRKQTLTDFLLVPNSVLRSGFASAHRFLLSMLDMKQHLDAAPRHQRQLRPTGSSLTMHDMDVIIHI